MKVILDCEPEDMAQALSLWFRIVSQNQTQEIGRPNAVLQNVGSKKFAVIRNLDSYTVKDVT